MRKFYSFLSLLLFFFAAQGQERTVNYGAGTHGFTVPCGVTSITVEAWGAGAAASDNGGGGGGAYAKRTIPVSEGQTYTVVVGRGGGSYSGSGNGAGENSRFSLLTTDFVIAEGGGKSGTNYRNGGRASQSIGAITLSGGNGGTRGSGNNQRGGGGGGSSAGSAGNGNNGGNGSGNNGGNGGLGPMEYSGNGGKGGNSNSGWIFWTGTDGSNGNTPGGGGGQGGLGDLIFNGSHGNGANGMVRITYLGGLLDGYCNISYSNVSPITYVEFAGIANSTSASTGAPSYENFCITGSVTPGTTYPIALKGYITSSNSSYRDYFTVYIDWNQNGTFETNERYNIGSINVSNTQVTGSIPVPPGAALGFTKMRVIKNFNGNVNNACNNKNTFGQVEDYIIEVTGCRAPTGATANGVSSLTVCEGESVTLQQTGGDLGSGQVWHWYKTNSSGTSLGTTTNPSATLNITADETTTYYVRAEGGTCGNGTGKTVTVTVNKKPTLTLYSGNKDLTICSNEDITDIIFQAGGGTTTVLIEGLPSPMNGSYNSSTKRFTISGYAYSTQDGVHEYRVIASGSGNCNKDTITGTITVVKKLTGITYSAPNVTYCIGGGITPNIPTVAGGTAVSFSVSPALPAGLNLDTVTGEITGTPTATQPSTDYEITATNGICSVLTIIKIAVSSTTGQTFNVTAVGNPVICDVGSVGIELSGSETGKNYQLFRDGVAVGSALSGTGNSLSFGNFSTSGTYTITTTDACKTQMNGSVTVVVTMTPTTTFSYDKSVFCQLEEFSGPVTFGGSSSVGTFSSGTGLVFYDDETGEIDLTNSTPGSYRITYTVPAAGGCGIYTCYQDIDIISSAAIYTVGGGGAYCEGTSGVEITLSNSQAGVQYQLYRGMDEVGSPVTGTGAAMSFGAQTVSGRYYIVALGDCGVAMGGYADVVMIEAPVQPTVEPLTSTICQGTILPLTATAAGLQQGSINFESGNINLSIPDNWNNNDRAKGVYHQLPVGGIPANAVITEVFINYNITHNDTRQLVINLRGPNGNVLNIANKLGSDAWNDASGRTNYTNTTVSSLTGLENISMNKASFTGTYAPQAENNIEGATSVPVRTTSNVTTFSGLYSGDNVGANGSWILSVRDLTRNTSGTFKDWSITIKYDILPDPLNVVWSSITDLFTDPGATIPYTGDPANTVYLKPSTSGSNKEYTAVNSVDGCSSSSAATINVNPTPVFSFTPDYCAEIQDNKIVVTVESDINVKPSSWAWGGSGFDEGPTRSATSSTIKTKTAGVYYMSAETTEGCIATGSIEVAQELVVNGDFEDGNYGFETDYTYVGTPSNTALWDEGTYTVDTLARDYHSNFWGIDHTTADGHGKFMIVNGHPSPSKVIWKQTVNVQPNTKYYFSAYAVSLNNDGESKPRSERWKYYADLVFTVNGDTVGVPTGSLGPKSPNNNSGDWKRFYGTWESGTNTVVDIEIINLNTELGGNDFGLDDISFGTLSTFFNETSGEPTREQQICADGDLTLITYEAGGAGDPPAITWSDSDPGGVTPYWNGRDYFLSGKPETPGSYEYTLSLAVCEDEITHEPQYLIRTGTLEVEAPSTPGTFKNLSDDAIAICYKTPGSIELEGTQGDILKWQKSDDMSSWTDISNTNTTYNYGSLEEPVYVRAFAKQPYAGCEEAVSDMIKLDFRNVWRGDNSDAWGIAGNWSFSTMPATECDYVIIPDVGANPYPVLKTPVQVNNLVMKDNGLVTLDEGAELKVSGAIISSDNANNGIINAKKGTITFNGSAAQTIKSNMFADTTINKLVVANSTGSGLSVSGSGASLAITDKIEFETAGSKLNSGNNITLKSTKERTASLGQLTPTSTVSGEFTVERYINTGTGPGEHGKKWMHLATPATGQTIRQSWMENGQETQGFGAYLTGPDGGGWDDYSPAPAVKEYNEVTNKWLRASSGNAPLYNEKGWQVYVRGDRTVKIATAPPNPTVLRAKGILKTHTQEITVKEAANPTDNWFTSVGNPYASAIDMRDILTKDGDFYTIWDPLLGPATGSGAYKTYTRIGNHFESNLGDTNNIILSGQGFFIQKNNAERKVYFKETAKVDTSANLTFFRKAGEGNEMPAMMKTSIYKGDQLEDGVIHMFSPEYSNDVDELDGRKMPNSGINLSVRNGEYLLVVERKQTIIKADTIQFNLTGTANGNYKFVMNAQNMGTPGLEAWFEDAFANSRTPVSLDGTTEITFDVNSAAASKAADRFRIVFDAKGILPVRFVKVNATKDGGDVNVTWTVAQELNVADYVVMASADGVNFKDIGAVKAGGFTNYGVVDESPVEGYNYYRVRSVDIDGAVRYSEIVKVFIGSTEPSLSVFPNPVTGGNVHLHLQNYAAGKYQVRLLNPAGQVVLTRSFDHVGGNHTEKIPWDYKMAHGSYHLEVAHPDGTRKVIVVMY